MSATPVRALFSESSSRSLLKHAARLKQGISVFVASGKKLHTAALMRQVTRGSPGALRLRLNLPPSRNQTARLQLEDPCSGCHPLMCDLCAPLVPNGAEAQAARSSVCRNSGVAACSWIYEDRLKPLASQMSWQSAHGRRPETSVRQALLEQLLWRLEASASAR